MGKKNWNRSARHAGELFERILDQGEATIDEFIRMREYENLFIDFKRSSDNGAGNNLHQNDRKNFSKAISGFGNSEGGILIWGIDCRSGQDNADVAQFKVPINDPIRFCSWLENAVSGLTMPPHLEVENKPILSNDPTKGFVVTYVPKSNYAPHQVIFPGKGQYHYFIRAGSNFSPTPHSVLAGMFGRRPQPSVFHMFVLGFPEITRSEPFSIKLELGLQVANSGPGIASDLFMTIKIFSKPGENCQLAISPQDPNNWNHWSTFGMQFSAISKYETRLPPDGILQPFVLSLELRPPFSRNIDIKGTCGAGNAPSFNFAITKEFTDINRYYLEMAALQQNGLLTQEKMVEFQRAFWESVDK